MNKSSARNVKEFCDIRARDAEGRATIVFVPGHEGREYFVFIHRNGVLRVRCNEPGPWGNHGCEGSRKHFCYHMLAALEFAAANQGMTLSWCESKADAERLARISGKVFHARSLQSDAEVWGVVRGSESETQDAPKDTLLDKATRYVALHRQWVANPSAMQDNKEWQKLHEYFLVKGWNYSTVERYWRENDPEAVLAHGRNVLRGEDVKEI